MIDNGCVSYEIALRCMLRDLTDDESTLIQAMAWWLQAWRHQATTWPDLFIVIYRH